MTEISKAKPIKPKTREYLESALSECRRLLPGWMFAVIHQAALPMSGGKAKRNRRMSAAEKAWIEKGGVGGMSSPELKATMDKLVGILAAYKRQGKKTNGIVARGREVYGEMDRRNGRYKGKVPTEFKKSDARPISLPKGTKIKKGFNNGEPEAGFHAHGLDRRNGQTLNDGPHIHLFVAPGSGDVLLTLEDGNHQHVISEGGNATERDGLHTHRVRRMDGTGEMVETKLGGKHHHDLMVETSGFDGPHTHTLVLEDGTEIESLMPGEFVDRFVNLEFFESRPIWSSTLLANALNEVKFLREGQFGEDDSFPPIEEALAMVACGKGMPDRPTTNWEVHELAIDGAHCCLDDMKNSILLKNPSGLHLDIEDIVEVNDEGEIVKHADSSVPHNVDEAKVIAKYSEALADATNAVAFTGPQDAKLVFVSASPSPLELARKEALIGPDGALFIERYLAPLGLSKSDVATGFAIPVKCEPTEADVALWRDKLVKSLAVYNHAKVVALGRVAKQALGDRMDFSLPHPAAVRRHGDRGEVDRKIRSICKTLDISILDTKTRESSTSDPSHGEPGTTLADSTSEQSKGRDLNVAVTKSLEEKQIVYGVILDPYTVDLQNDWLPPAEIETTAHDFLAKSRIVGLKHKGVAEAEVVESWVEIYPSPEDREQALQNLPHRVWSRKFGSDTVHSGAWILGVKLSDELWAEFLKGEIDAFSIGGFSFKTPISSDAMPEVEFIELQPNT